MVLKATFGFKFLFLLSIFSTNFTFADGVRYLPEKGYCVDASGARSLARNCIGSCCDMAYRDLRSEDLRGRDLRGANIYRADLRGVDLTGTNLERASLREAKLEGANLLFSKIKNTDLSGAVHSISTLLPFSENEAEKLGMHDVSLQNEEKVEVPAWSNSETYHFDPARHACFDAKGARGQNLRYFGECGNLAFEDLRTRDFRRGDFAGANFHNAVFEGADFTGANLEGAALSSVQIASVKNSQSAYRLTEKDLLGPQLLSEGLVALPALQAIDWQVVDQSLLPFFRDVEGFLPKKWREQLRSVKVSFRDLDSKGPISPVSCKAEVYEKEVAAFGKRVFGRFENGEVILHTGLLPFIRGGESTAPLMECGPGRHFRNAYRFAQSKLVHELAHFYDSKSSFSENSRFRQIRQWTRTSVLGLDDQKNAHASRSPNAYEYQTPEESFAVNSEYFVLDPNFACHRPSTNFALIEELGAPPIQRVSKPCALSNEVVVRSPRYPEKAAPMKLDPERLYEAHYFIASKGEETGSGFGHSMLRLIFCAPGRAEVGPDCLRDHAYHVVVSFRANVFDMSLDAWKGMVGGYPSQMFLFEMNDVVDDYTKAEFRNLISVPLKLSSTERQHLVLHVLELYWEYLGRYYFLANNCATETLDMIKAVVPDERLQSVSAISPFGVYEGLLEAGLLNDSVLFNPSYAVRSGSYFTSQERAYEGAFKLIKALAPELRWTSYEDYAKNSKAAERIALYQIVKEKRAREFSHIDLNLLTGNFALLESRALEYWRLWFLKEMFTRLDANQIPKRFEEKLKLLAFESASAVHPARPDMSGYGIPLASDIPVTNSSESKAKLDTALKDLRSWFAQEFKEQLSELSETDRNLSQFKRWIVVEETE